MAEENFSFQQYGIFSDGINTAKTLNNSVADGVTALNELKSKIAGGSIFMGPAADSAVEGFGKVEARMSTMTNNFNTISGFLADSSIDYKASDDKAQKTISMENGVVKIGAAAQTSNTGNANQDAIYNYLAKQGFNNAAICGILANIQHESNFNPQALGDNGTSYGICQWHNSRWDSLKSFCSNNGLDSTTIDGQMAYLMYELKEKYPSIYESMKNVPNTEQGAYDAAYIWTVKFERPAGMEASGAKRGNTAKSKYWPAYQT